MEAWHSFTCLRIGTLFLGYISRRVFISLGSFGLRQGPIAFHRDTARKHTQKWQVVVFLCMCVTEREKDGLFELEMQMNACIVVRGTHSLHRRCLRVRACAHTYPQKHSKRSNSRHPHAAAFYAICALRSMPSFGSIY